MIRQESMPFSKIARRRDLLPDWIKIFTWIFMILLPITFCFAVYFVIPDGLMITSVLTSTYALMTFFGAIIWVVLCLSAYALWFEKKWAASLAIKSTQAFILISILKVASFFAFGAAQSNVFLHIPVDLIIAFPFLFAMKKLKPEWEDFE